MGDGRSQEKEEGREGGRGERKREGVGRGKGGKKEKKKIARKESRRLVVVVKCSEEKNPSSTSTSVAAIGYVKGELRTGPGKEITVIQRATVPLFRVSGLVLHELGKLSLQTSRSTRHC